MKKDTDAYAWRAMLEARKVVKEYEITSLPVDPIALAEELGIEVLAKPATSPGISGFLLRFGNDYGIAYATHIDNAGFQNFSVGHELGHYFMPGHVEAVLADNDVHESRAGFSSSDRYETEADHFSGNLLMPDSLFTKAIDRAGEGLGAIEGLASLCVTSLTATAIRYMQCANTAGAMIVSSGDRVEYCFMSAPLREVQGLEWIRKGETLPHVTATARFNQDPDRVLGVERSEDTCDLQDWFGGDISAETTEEVVGLGRYGKTLTILTPTSIPDPQDLQEEEGQMESWKPRFKR